MSRRLSEEEKFRLRNIWRRTCRENETFNRYDMNFVLALLKGHTDFIDQAFEKDSDEIAHLLPKRG